MNKKILSIFVMIMALSLFGVSCSNEETTGTTTTTPTLDISLDTASKVLADPKTTTISFTASDNTGTGITADTASSVKIKLTGTDVANVEVGTGNKVVATVESVTGLAPSALGNTSVGESAHGTTKADLSSISGANLVTLGGDKTDGLTLAISANGLSTIFQDGDSILDTDADFGVLKVTIKFEDKTNAKNSTTIDVYVELIRKD